MRAPHANVSALPTDPVCYPPDAWGNVHVTMGGHVHGGAPDAPVWIHGARGTHEACAHGTSHMQRGVCVGSGYTFLTHTVHGFLM